MEYAYLSQIVLFIYSEKYLIGASALVFQYHALYGSTILLLGIARQTSLMYYNLNRKSLWLEPIQRLIQDSILKSLLHDAFYCLALGQKIQRALCW